MAQRSAVLRQRDFSGGELIDAMKRRDDQPIMRSGGRQMQNWRIQSSGNLVDRPGRTALYQQAGRTQTFLMPGDVRYRISFGNGTISIRDINNVVVASASGYPWTLSTRAQISWTVINRDLLMCFPGSVPKVARRATDGSWSFFDFAFATGYQGELRAPFYRFPETLGITMLPSARTGAITVTFSAPVLYPSHVGCNFRYKGCQVTITSYISSTQANATVLQPLPPAQILGMASVDGYFVGQVVSGYTSSATGEITAVDSVHSTITVQLKTIYSGFQNGEYIVGPSSRSQVVASGGVASTTVQPSVDWDEQAASSYRGWPQACLYDRSRLTMFNLPQIPEGIIWSATSAYADFYVGADANEAMFELVPGRKHVLYMLGGPDQFVFTDAGVYYIPISESNPLKPGSVAFVLITPDGCGTVQPITTNDGLVYVNDGLSRIISVYQTGAVTRPYMAQDITEFSSHLIKTPVCITATTGASDFPERYVYVVNSDGSVSVGRYSSNKQWVGWTPWVGQGKVTWASALGSEMIYNVDYVGTSTVSLVEKQDNTQLMDCCVTLNSVISTLAPGSGQGPLWFWAGQTVDLFDQGRDLGNRSIDATGKIVALLNDDFTSATIVAGRGWQGTFEPFLPHAQEGADLQQTHRRRRLKEAAIAVEHSVGFEWGGRTIPAYAWGDEGGLAPPQRESTYKFKNLGRTYDPRAVLTKSRPGSISIVEVSIEVTI